MKSNLRGAAWPYLFILLALFALSITAPRAWNRQRYAGPAMADLLTDQQADAPPDAAESQSQDVCPSWIPKEKYDGDPVADPDGASTPNSASTSSGISIGPTIVAPLREFGRRVIDPIVEFAKRPTELRALPDLFFPRFETDDKAADPSAMWALPETLLEALDQLKSHEEAADWATRVSQQIRELHKRDGMRPATVILSDLRTATVESALPKLNDPIAETDMRRVRYALERRLEVWDVVAQQSQAKLNDAPETSTQERDKSERLTKCVADVERLTATVSSGDAWRDYLMVEQLRTLMRASEERKEKHELARKVLARLATQKLSPKQRQFAAKSPIASLSDALHGWAAEPVEMAHLLADLERYEGTQLVSDAQRLAADSRWLQWTSGKTSQDLGERINLHYRNANVRVALSPAFVNRFVPQPTTTSARVLDTIHGVPVRGRSTTFTSVKVRAIPDPRRIRLGMEADGIVASDTTSDAGPATFYNQAQAGFQVRKLVLIGPVGVRVWPSISDADSYYTNLTDVETSFDIVPLVGPLMRNFARTQHEDAQPEARREMEGKVAARARRQFDDEVRPRLEQLTSKVDAEMLEPLRRMGLEPTAIEMQTTDDRLTTRIRLAGEQQLGAHTPRPRAPSDSLASLQIHQSAINNVLEALDLGDREFTVPELYAWISGKLHRVVKPPEDVPDDVIVKFAAKDALRIRCVDGHLELAVAIAKLSHGKNRWREFVVRTTYQPDPSSLEARFVRSGSIFLEGKSLQGRVEFVLRSILSKAFSVDHPWRIVPEKFAADPRIADLEITQFVVEDGWIGVAYAPTCVSSQTARRPK